jgi:radical SAM family uncharacterized protein/radical SAM-linked protein
MKVSNTPLDLKNLDRILLRVQKPTRYTGGEWNSIKKDANQAQVKVALAFPDTYEIGMSHLGLKILYALLNNKAGVVAERVFTPWVDFENELRRNNIPLYSLESKRPLREFDFIGFSIQTELCYTNILTMLDLSGIPLRAADRDLTYPLIIGGGPCVSNPEPIAQFFDLFLIGEAEEALPELLDRYHELTTRITSFDFKQKERLLRELVKVPGLYAPMLYRTARQESTGLLYALDPKETASAEDAPPFPIKRRVVADLSKFPFPQDPIVPFNEIVHDRVSIEVARGCTEGCRFCQAGTIYRPVRERKAEEVVNTVARSLEKTGYDEVSLASLSFGDYSCATPLVKKMMETLEKKRTALSLPSLRAYALTEEVSEEIKKVRRTGFTIAPEGGTQRMRDVINKNITEQDVINAASAAFGNGWNLIKLYFMIGQPTETDEDVTGIVDMAYKVLGVARRIYANNGKSKAVKVNLSASCFVPKPQTPFQWYGMDTADSLRRKQKLIRGLIKTNQIHFKAHEVETSVLEGIFSRGDRALGPVIENAWRKGCRFDNWTEQFRYDLWMQAFEEEHIDPETYLREFPLDAHLPWDHIDSLVKKSFLAKEWQKALAAKVSPPCEKPYLPRVLKEWGMEEKAAVAGMNHIGDKSTFESRAPLVCYNCGLECNLNEIRQERIENFRAISHPKADTLASTPLHSIEQTKNQPDESVYCYRACYTKLKEAKYISSLDLTRTMSRAFLRAGIRLKYSQGFHPVPAISFGPALSVGIESDEEYLDFQVYEKITKEDFLARVNSSLPEGLQFTDLVEISPRAESLFKMINLAIYSIKLDADVVRPTINTYGKEKGLDALSDAEVQEYMVAEFKRRDKVIVVREREGKKKEIDILPLIKDIKLAHSDASTRVVLTLSMDNGSSVKPEEILKEVFGIAGIHFPTRREKLLCHYNGKVLSPIDFSQAQNYTVTV